MIDQIEIPTRFATNQLPDTRVEPIKPPGSMSEASLYLQRKVNNPDIESKIVISDAMSFIHRFLNVKTAFFKTALFETVPDEVRPFSYDSSHGLTEEERRSLASITIKQPDVETSPYNLDLPLHPDRNLLKTDSKGYPIKVLGLPYGVLAVLKNSQREFTHEESIFLSSVLPMIN